MHVESPDQEYSCSQEGFQVQFTQLAKLQTADVPRSYDPSGDANAFFRHQAEHLMSENGAKTKKKKGKMGSGAAETTGGED